MSLNTKKELVEVAKIVCRKLRRNSTEAEIILWEELRNRKLLGKKFLRQHPIFYDLSGIESFVVADFYCHEEKLIIELDGEYHNYRLKEDSNRTSLLNLLGLKVIRYKNEEVLNDFTKVINQIKENLEIK